MMEKKDWSRKEVYRLIREYESFPCLWDLSIKEYRDKIKKMDALSSLAASFDTTVPEIMRKLHNLRSQFNNELRKLTRKKSEQGADDGGTTSKWPFFNCMRFVQRGVLSRPTTGTILLVGDDDKDINRSFQSAEESNDDSSVVYTEEQNKKKKTEREQEEITRNRASQNVHKEVAKRITPIIYQKEESRKRKMDEEEEELVGEVNKSQLKKEDQYTVFANFVASELRSLSRESLRRKAKRKIQQVLLEVSQEDDDLYLCSKTVTYSHLSTQTKSEEGE